MSLQIASPSIKRLPLSGSICSLICLAGSLQAAQISWTTSPGLTDTEVRTTGTQVFGYYWGSSTPTVLVNTVPFVQVTSIVAPAGINFNGDYDHLEAAVDLYQVPITAANAGLNQILDGQNWGDVGGTPLTLTGLTSGQQYLLQYMISDDRTNFRNIRNYDVSDGADAFGSRDIQFAYHSTAGGGVPAAAPAGAREAKIFTGMFTADPGGTQDITNWLYGDTVHGATNAGTQVNAIQVRAVPEPTTFILAAGAACLLGASRRRRRT
jgi:hypothetical protein